MEIYAKSSSLPIAPPDEKAWIQFEFAKPQTICAITLATGRLPACSKRLAPGGEVKRELEASDDGAQFQSHRHDSRGRCRLTHPGFFSCYGKVLPRCVYIAQTHHVAKSGLTATFEWLVCPQPATRAQISELVLHTAARVNRFEEKAAFAVAPDLYDSPDAGCSAIGWFGQS